MSGATETNNSTLNGLAMCPADSETDMNFGDTSSVTSSQSLDHYDQQQQQLHQTTQSLLMASSMLLTNTEQTATSANLNEATGGVDSAAYKTINLYSSIESFGELPLTHSPTPPWAVATVNARNKYDVDELANENHVLRERLKAVSIARDRLLCEVSKLRLELNMSELQRLPEESFPQKNCERSGSSQYGISSAPVAAITDGGDSNAAGNTVRGGVVSAGGGGGGSGNAGNVGGGNTYLQHYYTPSMMSSLSGTNSINYSVATQPMMMYQHPAQQYATCHQQELVHQSPNISSAGGVYYSHYMKYHPHHHHHLVHGHHHHHHGGAVVIAGSGVGTGLGVGSTSPSAMQQNLHKKNSIRNGGEILKHSRSQPAYELSQDLLEKQIELLERKYGGVCARNAATTIQRAFRHYMMVKKFASITAMAKAEKRLSRRMMIASNVGDDGPPSNSSLSSAYGSATESQLEVTQASQQQQQQQLHQQQQQQLQHQQQPRVTIMAGPPGAGSGVGIMGSVTGCSSITSPASARTPPTRSLSMRERRQMDGSPLPRSQSGASSVSVSGSSSVSSSSTLGSGTGSGSGCSTGSTATHPHVNLLHAAEPHFFSSHHVTGAQAGQYYSGGYHALSSHDASFASSANSSSAHLDSSLNVSWVSAGSSPHTPYYSATQIYMRPKGVVVQTTSSSSSSADRKKVPPEVPKRTSSITAQQHAQHLAAQQQQLMMMRQTPPPPSMLRSNGLCKTAENGSLTSVQSSGSESSVTSTERLVNNSDIGSDRSNSPQTWKRGTTLNSSQQFSGSSVVTIDPAYAVHAAQAATPGTVVVMSNAGVVGGSGAGVGMGVGSNVANAAAAAAAGTVTAVANVVDDHAISSHTSAAQYGQHEQQDHQINVATGNTQNFKVSETIRKRQYRVGLNLFNKKPEKGITYLIRRGFLENTPQGVARFLISRKGLSRQMIGEYLGNLQNQFNMAVLNCFAMELDLSGMQVDVALRKFQAYFRMPGEAQKIERLMEVFSHRYCQCNQDIVGRLRSSDTIFVLAFAIIMLNTDLHTPNLKPERRMRIEEFIKNLRGIDDCHDIERDMLAGTYERVKANEFKPGSDHVTQVMKVQATIVGKKPNLALPHRRLVCYCRLYEIPDVNKKERPGVHQREVFLFNDLLVITKIFSKKKSSVTYTFRNSFPLCGMVVTMLDVPNYPFCIELSQKVDGKTLITFNARNDHDRLKFAEDLKESISEMDEMEALRIEAELERQKSARNRAAGSSENRDSGVADVEVCPCPYQAAAQPGETAPCANDASSQQLKRSALSNSLLDMHEQFGNDKPQRRGSVGSLDSGMSISFQSTTTSSASRDNAAAVAAAANAAAAKMRFNHAGGGGGGGAYTAAPPGAAAASASVMQAANAAYVTHAGYVQQSHAANAALILQQQQQQIAQQQQQQQQHQHHHHHQQHHQQQQQQHQHLQQPGSVAQTAPVSQPLSGRIPGRERKLSRSDESGRSTEV